MKNSVFASLFIIGIAGLLSCRTQNAQIGNQSLDSNISKNNEKVVVKQENLLEKVVLEYCKLAKDGNKAELQKLATRTPKSYHDYSAKYWEKELAKIPIEEENSEKKNKQNSSDEPKAFSPSTKPIDDLTYKNVADRFPLLIKDRKMYVERVINSWEKNNEGRVKIEFKSDDFILSPTFSEIDFYLFKDRDKNWKIFKIEFSDWNNQETYPM